MKDMKKRKKSLEKHEEIEKSERYEEVCGKYEEI